MVDLQDLVDEASTLLEAPVTLEDRRFRLLASGAHAGGADPVRVETVLGRGSGPETRAWFESFGIARARRPVHVSADPERGVSARLCLPARWHDVVQGYLWAIEPPEGLAPERVRAAEDLAAHAGEILARLTSRRRDTERLVLDLLEPTAGGGAARELADDLALAPGAVVSVAVLGTRPGQTLRADQVLGPAGVPRWVGVAERGGDLVLVVPATSAAAATDVVADALAGLDRLGTPGAVAGVGDVVPLADAATSYRRARAALRVVRPHRAGGPSSTPALRVHPWSALGIRRLLGGAAGDELVEAVRTPPVEELLAASGELLVTARIYLDEAGSVAATAAHLGLHRQSVYHRLQRIEQVTGLDLSRGRDRLELHLGLLVLTDEDGGGPAAS